MEQRESFVFYRSFQEAISEADENTQLVVYRAIAQYALDRIEPNLTGIGGILWKLIKPQLDANWRRYENGCKGKEHGKKGGNPNFEKGKRNPYYQDSDTKITPKITPKLTPNDNVNDNDNVNEKNKEDISKDISKKNIRFSPPTLEEVKTYIQEKEYPVDAERWYNFYESKGWMIGKNKMKNWHAAIATWAKTENEHHTLQAGKSTIQKNCNSEWE